MHKWPLNVSNFTWVDRLKICKFFLTPSNFWTMNKYVQEYEKQMASFMGFKFAVYVSSGSTANTILAMYLKDKLVESGEFKKRNIIVLPSTTWQTSCSPWIREGFKPYFIDISLDNFGMDLQKLENFLNKNHSKVSCVFPTSLLGFNLDYSKLKKLKSLFTEISFYVDQCENNFGEFSNIGAPLSTFTSTTSTYMGHELQSVEGGFIFTNSQTEYEQFLMYRNHGMVRSLSNTTFELQPQTYNELIGASRSDTFHNDKVDCRFDFYSFGNNFRNSDLHAFIGLLDFERAFKYVRARRNLYKIFWKNLNQKRYILPYIKYNDITSQSNDVPFCLPIICNGDGSQDRLRQIKSYCIDNSIETRPIISGFLGYQTAYKGLMDEKDYPNSVYLHNNGIYIGLHPKVTKKQILKLVDFLNKI